MARITALIFLAATLSVYWAILLVSGYQRSERDHALPGPEWAKDLIWKVYLPSEDDGPPRAIDLPPELEKRSQRGDRKEEWTHSVKMLGLQWSSTEVFVSREDRRIVSWRQHGVPPLLLFLAAALSPLLLAAVIVGSVLWVTPSLRQSPQWKLLGRVALGAAGVVVLLVTYVVEKYEPPGAFLVWQAAQGLKGAPFVDGHPDGAWTGDVTELYRMGAIRRAVAEADTAPIRPLVPRPKPYHGYFFVAMETGPSTSTDSDEPVPLKKSNRNRHTYAFCAYPAKPGPNQQVWIVCPTGFFGRRMEGGKPVLNWPTWKEMQQGWGRYCRSDVPAPLLQLAHLR